MNSSLFNNQISTQRSPFSLDKLDMRTMLFAISLVAAGLISIYSATYTSGMSKTFTLQLVFSILGAVVMMVVAFLPMRWIQLATWPLYITTQLLLVAVLFIGTVKHGQRCWIDLGPISIQPSEIAKLGVLMAAGTFLERDRVDLRNWRSLVLLAMMFLGPVALIMMQPDAGSATVFLMLLLGVALWGGTDLFLLFAIVAPGIVGLSALFGLMKGAGQIPMLVSLGFVLVCLLLFRRRLLPTVIALAIAVGVGFSTPMVYDKLPAHQKDRIQTFLDPEHDPKGKGYHVLQSLMAVGSGGLTGKGFLNGTQTHLNYIPEQSTDFIYSVPTEEFGFVGGVVVILLLVGLIWSAISTASHLRSRFESTVCAGIAVIFLYHTTINIGMAMGLVPVIGVPLPFLSKGGSSLALNMLMVGLLLNFYRSRQDVTRRDEQGFSE